MDFCKAQSSPPVNSPAGKLSQSQGHFKTNSHRICALEDGVSVRLFWTPIKLLCRWNPFPFFHCLCSLILHLAAIAYWRYTCCSIHHRSLWRVKLCSHSEGGLLLFLKSLFISRNWIFHAVIKICRSNLPWHRFLLIWESNGRIRLRCSSPHWDLKDEGWHFPPFCKLMPLICLTRTKLGFKIPNDKEIKTLNGFPKTTSIVRFQAEYWTFN